jgi:RNA polymerase sigma-70 factor (ECF subfamily)
MNQSGFTSVFKCEEWQWHERRKGLEVERFEELLQACRSSLERFVFYRIPNREDSEDLLADIQLKAFEKRDSLLDPQRFKAWILRIASNRCNDYFREQAKSLEIEWQDSIVAAI